MKNKVLIRWNKDMKRLMQKPKTALFVGYFDDSGKYSDGTKLSEVALWNEYGTISKKGKEHIPPRPFLRNTINNQANIDKFARIIGYELAESGDLNLAFERCANVAVSAVKKSIRSNTPPPNDPATIKAKGSSHTLIDTGKLMGGVDYKIKADND